MAEAAGLALGGIALASMFSTCVELFDYFELSRSYEYDYDQACRKLSLLRARLNNWGDCFDVAKVGHHSEQLGQSWAVKQKVIKDSLQGISDIFTNAGSLEAKYRLLPRKPGRSSVIKVALRRFKLTSSSTVTAAEASSSHSPSLIRRSTIWAIRDKQKFDIFIHELEFYIDNLESLIFRVDMSDSKAPKSNSKQKRQSPSRLGEDSSDGERKKAHSAGRSFSIDKVGEQARAFQHVDSSSKESPFESNRGQDQFQIRDVTGQAVVVQDGRFDGETFRTVANGPAEKALDAKIKK